MDIGDRYFINEIGKRKSIWDSSSEEYKTILYKKNDWAEICNIFYPNFEEMDDLTKSHILNFLQARWQMHLESYFFVLQQTMSGNIYKIEHVFAQELAFLKSVIPAHTGKSLPEQVQTENVRKEVCDYNSRSTLLENHSYNKRVETTRTSNHSPNKSPNKSHGRKRKALDRKFENSKSDQSKKHLRPNFQSDDKEYCDSLFTTIQSIPSHLKQKFQTETTKLAQELIASSSARFSEHSASFTSDAQNPVRPSQQFYSPPFPSFQETQYSIPPSKQLNDPPLLDIRHPILSAQQFNNPLVCPYQITQYPTWPLGFHNPKTSPLFDVQHSKRPPESYYHPVSTSTVQAFQTAQHPTVPYYTSNVFPFLKIPQQSLYQNNHFEKLPSSVQLPKQPC